MLKFFRDPDGPSIASTGSVVCIGAFDGLHLGHQALISQACARAREYGVPAVVLCFEPLPRELFSPAGTVPRLMGVREKCQELRRLGADAIGLLRFDHALAATTREDFARGLLAGRLHALETWTGLDFRFGHRNAGDVDFLRHIGSELGFAVRTIGPRTLDGRRISSSAIRQTLRDGDLALAERLLGRRFALAGRLQADRVDPERASIHFRHFSPLSGHYRALILSDQGTCQSLVHVQTAATATRVVFPMPTWTKVGQRIHIQFLARQ